MFLSKEMEYVNERSNDRFIAFGNGGLLLEVDGQNLIGIPR